MRLGDALAEGRLSDHDREEVEAFSRFLREVGRPSPRTLRRDNPGWLPYVLGEFFGIVGPWPPEGYGPVPVTAWTFPA